MGMKTMPRRLPPHVERLTVKGNAYLYFRRDKGPRTRLPDDPGSEAFALAYAAALTGHAKPAKELLPSRVKGTIAALITDYSEHALIGA